MSDPISRRKALGTYAAAIGGAAFHELLAAPSQALASSGAGATTGIRYFARFGVTEKLIRDTLGEALSSGGDFADVFFQHKVGNTYVLEDGAVNRAFTNVELGVGVRVVKGDQTGYAYTEDLTLEAMRGAAQSATRCAARFASAAASIQAPRSTSISARATLHSPWNATRPG